MWLYFSALSSEGNLDCHSFCSSRLEHHLDVLNDFVATGYQLLCAWMQEDDGKRFNLPLEAFDGRPMSNHLIELQRQYQQILDL